MNLPKGKLRKLSLFFLLLFLFAISLIFSSPVKAQSTTWVPDSEVTMLGKASERARQLLFWVFSRPTLDNSSAILGMWAISRNIALIFLLLIILGYGFQLILSKEKTRFEVFLPRFISLLIFAVFSYTLVLLLIQIGDVVMKFFIERVLGQNLFNISFVGQNTEENYMKFLGFRLNDAKEAESAATAMFLIKLTNFTYYVMFIMMVLRKVILWFLLIIAPFLSLLFAFPFIKNVGWIWLGVFFQWLFYGPLFSIFLAGMVKIWEMGIPYDFDFTKVGVQSDDPKKTGVVYKTAINILYGGPAQTLAVTNSCNYVDTFAEYLIALIMLWAVILLPWLLLRIFRDYCCGVIKSLEAATMNLYGKITGTLPPPTMPTPAAARLEVPLKKPVESRIPAMAYSSEAISKMRTEEILNAVGLKVSSLADISRLDMNSEKREEASKKLDYLQSPFKVSNVSLRGQFAASSQELAARATKGDVVAERTITAASKPSIFVMAGTMQKQREKVAEKETVTGERVIAREGVTTGRGVIVGRPQLAEKERTAARMTVRARRVGLPAAAPVAPRTVSVEDYEEVKRMWINNYRLGEVPYSEKIRSREDWLKNEIAKISNAIEMISSKEEVKKREGFEDVAAIMPFLFLGGFTDEQVLVYLKAKLEAAKAQQEFEAAQLAGKETEEKEEELVEVPRFEEEKKKTAELQEALEIKSEEESAEAKLKEGETGGGETQPETSKGEPQDGQKTNSESFDQPSAVKEEGGK